MSKVPFILLPLLVACGPKKAPEPVVSAAPEVKTEVPDDATSRKFSSRLLALDITDWNPEDTGSAEFKYGKFSFNKDNTWNGAATLTVIDESVNCSEKGTWSMDPADSETTATVTWTIDSTDCPGREKGKALRVQMTIGDDGKITLFVR